MSAQQIAVLDLLGEPRGRNDPHIAALEARRYLPLMLTEMSRMIVETESQPVQNIRRVRSLQAIEALPHSTDSIGLWRPRWKMVFTWQCPIMFMSYSVNLFLLGLTVLVCTPFIQGGGWDKNHNVREDTCCSSKSNPSTC